jgi:hypothetical protein
MSAVEIKDKKRQDKAFAKKIYPISDDFNNPMTDIEL